MIPVESGDPGMTPETKVDVTTATGRYPVLSAPAEKLRDPTVPPSDGPPTLVFANGAMAGRRVPIPSRGLVIGRETDCDVPLADASVSRRHARLWPRGRRLWLEDLGSTNGTRVNGVPGIRKIVLHPGDEIQVGHQTFTLEDLPQPSRLTLLWEHFRDHLHELRARIPNRMECRQWWRHQPLGDRVAIVALCVVVLGALLWILCLPQPEQKTEAPTLSDLELTAGQRTDVRAGALVAPDTGEDLEFPRRPDVPSPAATPAPPGSLRIVATPPGVDIYIDGRLHGAAPPDPRNAYHSSPVLIRDLKPGGHRVSLRFRQTQSPPTPVTVDQEKATELDLTLWLPDHIFVLNNGRRLLAMVRQRTDQGWLVQPTADEQLFVSHGEVAKVTRVPPVVMRGDEGVQVTPGGTAAAPELLVDPFPADP